MNRPFTTAVLSLCVVLMALLACKGKPKVIADAKQIGDVLELRIDVSPATSGSARLEGQAAFEQLRPIDIPASGTTKVDVPLADVPIGQHTITVTFTGKGKGLAKSSEGKTSFTFDRAATAPTLALGPVAQPEAIEVGCKGDLCAEGTRLPITADAKLSVDLASCDGCSVEIGGQKIAVTGEHTAALVDLAPVVGAAPVSELASVADMKIPVKITSKDGAVTESSAELLGAMVGGAVFKRIERGPVAFPDEAAAPAAPKSAVIVRREAGYGVLRTVGSAQLGRDVDLVGSAKATETNLGSCGIYEKSDTKEKVNVAHKGVSYQVAMFDRRTGKTLGRRTFHPVNESCADKLVAGVSVIYSYPADTDLDDWATTFLR